jgi:TRAP-type C4-dicarboxylate transport system permease small subunit
MRFIKLLFDWVFLALAWFALLLLVCMTALIFADVFCRYLLHFSIAWADEITLIFLVWYVFIALAIGVRKGVHTSIDLIKILVPNKYLDWTATRLVDLLTILFGGLLVYFGKELIEIGTYSTLASIDLPSYWEYIFIPISGVLVVYSALVRMFQRKSAEPQVDLLDTIFMYKADRNV